MAMIQKLPFIDKKSLENSNLFNGDFDLPNLYIAIKFRRSLKKFCRYNELEIIFKRYILIIKLIYNRYINKKNKVLPRNGTIIAFCGVDGSGKSTLNNQLSLFF